MSDERPPGYSVGEAKLKEQLDLAGINGWRHNFHFHPVRKWHFDFAWEGVKLAIEVEGGTWARGRHTRGAGFAEDCEKYAEGWLLGWNVLRFTTEQVYSGMALRYIIWALKRLETEAR